MSTVKLDVPYRSQWDADARQHAADCGPTALAMLLNALGDPITPDEAYRYLGRRGTSQYTSFADLARIALARGLTLRRQHFPPARALDGLRASVDAGRPLIALVNYALWEPIVRNGFRGSHFVLAVGYDDSRVLVHDPLFRGGRREQGRYCAWPDEQFRAAWGGFEPRQNPNFAALISQQAVRRLGPELAPTSAPQSP